MRKILFLIRGLPGSGKSTLGEYLVKNTLYINVEADQFFIKDGKYTFDGSKLKEAHKWCINKVEDDMKCHAETFEGEVPNSIVVSNTFTTEKEMQPYYELAQKYNYNVVSLIVENRHNGINIHNVPQETMEKMKNRFEIKL